MAAAKTTAKPAGEAPAKNPKEDLVPFYAIKDNDRYQNDIVGAVNGRTFRIKRGVHVMIPRHIYMCLKNSQMQDVATSNLIDAETSKFKSSEQYL